MKLTKWFSPKVKPTLPGFYERNYYMYGKAQNKALCNDYWDGKEWRIAVPSNETYPGALQHLKWRGLAEKP